MHKVWKKSSATPSINQDIQPHLTRLPSGSRDGRVQDEISLEHLFESGGLCASRDGDTLPTQSIECSAAECEKEMSTYNPSSSESTPGKEDSVERENYDQIDRTCGKDTSSFCPITMELNAANIPDLLLAAEEGSGSAFQRQWPFAVVGLHTCGDLACSALRLFAQVPQVACVCVVGCCYHHITENITEEEGKRDHGLFFLSVYGQLSGLYVYDTYCMSQACNMGRYFKSMLKYFHNGGRVKM